MNLKFTSSNNIKQLFQLPSLTESSAETELKNKNCRHLQSIALNGNTAYIIRILAGSDPESSQKADLYIYENWGSGNNEIRNPTRKISIVGKALWHANGMDYYNGHLYVARLATSKDSEPEYQVVKLDPTKSNPVVSRYTIYHPDIALDSDKIRGITYFKDGKFILRTFLPKEKNKNLEFIIGYFEESSSSDSLYGKFIVEDKFYVQNSGDEASQDIHYDPNTNNLYIVTCKKAPVQEGSYTNNYWQNNCLLQISLDKNRISTLNNGFPLYNPTNHIVINAPNNFKRIFEVEALAIDRTAIKDSNGNPTHRIVLGANFAPLNTKFETGLFSITNIRCHS